MNTKVEDFLIKISNENEHYGLATKWYAQRIESVCDFDTVMMMSVDKLSELFIKLHPINTKAISSYLNVLKRYAEYTNNQSFIDISKKINVTAIWNQYSSSAEKTRRYVSNSEFQSILFNLQMDDMMNVDYYVALLQAIYEGIYSDDLTALSNLRGQDIHGNVVVVRCDGKEPFELEISHNLVTKLKELSNLTSWGRKNRCGEFSIVIEGNYPDSCFKVENRNNIPDRSYRHCYYRYIRKVASIIGLDYQLRAKNLYISGIMCRAKKQIEEKGMDFEQTFAFNRRWGEDVDIVRRELERVHYPYPYSKFTALISGYIDDFQD